MKTRLLLVDDHTMVRQTLRKRLEMEPDFELVGEVENGRQVEPKVAKHRPDVVILDVSLPGLNGLEVSDRLRERHPQTRVVILSMHTDEAYVLKALDSGASAYVVKTASVEELIKAVREVRAGREYLSEPFTEMSIEAYKRKAAGRPVDAYETLTRREKEVLQLVAEGSTNKEAADRMFINERTVETHRAHIMDKLKLRNLAELVRFALERGLVDMQGQPPRELEAEEGGPPQERGQGPPHEPPLASP